MLFFWRQPKYQSEVHQFMMGLFHENSDQKEKGLQERVLMRSLDETLELQNRKLPHRANPYF